MIDAITSRISRTREELHRRQARLRSMLDDPWLRVGLAAFIGYRLGSPRRTEDARATRPVRDDTLTQAFVRAGLLALAQTLARRALIALAD